MNERAEIIFQNDSLIAVYKPPGILSVPDRYNPLKFSVANWITSTHPDARPLHRIDLETSGILLFCSLPESFGWYSDQFEKRTVSKTYQTILEGKLGESEGSIDAPLYVMDNGKVIISKKGKASQTNWKVIRKFLHYSFVEANPLTGRTHQIRVHFSSIGHPVLCDTTYGAKGPLLLSTLKGRHRYKLSKNDANERSLISRTALHAGKIELSDYATGKNIRIEASLPKDMRVALQNLDRYDA